MIKTNDEKVREAIAYLRSRNKYLLDGCKWAPTPADKTDVKKTIAEYRESVKIEPDVTQSSPPPPA